MAEYKLSPKAQHDLEGVFDYTVSTWNLDQAIRYTDEIESACARLAAAPDAAQACDAIRTGYRRHIVGRHMIYFRKTPYGIAIIRILHHRMDAARHL